jgi:hypothetical protein
LELSFLEPLVILVELPVPGLVVDDQLALVRVYLDVWLHVLLGALYLLQHIQRDQVEVFDGPQALHCLVDVDYPLKLAHSKILIAFARLLSLIFSDIWAVFERKLQNLLQWSILISLNQNEVVLQS